MGAFAAFLATSSHDCEVLTPRAHGLFGRTGLGPQDTGRSKGWASLCVGTKTYRGFLCANGERIQASYLKTIILAT